MRTNIEINDTLMQQAMRAGRFSSKKAAVEAALQALVQGHEQRKILKLFGKVAWEGDLNESRNSKHLVAQTSDESK